MNDIPKHHPIGPSKARWAELCPAGPRMEALAASQGLAASGYEAAALEGTDRHLEAAKGLPGGEPGIVQEFIRTVAPPGGRISESWEYPLVVLGRQQEVLTYGTADYIACYGDKTIIVDFKHGHGDLDLESAKLQLELYSAAIIQEWRGPVVAYLFHVPEKQVQSWVFTDSKAIVERYGEILSAASDPGAPTAPGYVQCRYCRGKAVCPAWKEALAITQTLEPKDVGLLAPKDLAAYLEVASIAEPWAKAVKAACKDLAAKGVEVPGWQLVQRKHSSTSYKSVLDSFTETHKEHIGELESLREAHTSHGIIQFWKRAKEAPANGTRKSRAKALGDSQDGTNGASEASDATASTDSVD